MTERTPFGTHDGQPVTAVTLTAGRLRARLITFGARLAELWVPARDGTLADIVLGFDTLDEYVATDTYFGATCGRYGNRIRKGRFTLDGAAVQLDCNERGNHLHGGVAGFDRKVWIIADLTDSRVVFTAVSGAGEMGFPGRSNLTATYDLTPGGLTITMQADTDAPTVMNMVHHSYFNLGGQGSGDVLGQMIHLDAPFYTPVDAELLATGEVLAVTGTAFDFTQAKPIGRDIAALPGVGAEIFGEGGGYDHNWVLDGTGACATAWDPGSGRKMVLTTTEPGVQFYTGGYLSPAHKGKAGATLCKFAGFTLEAQKFPDAPNFAHFPPCRLNPGQTYRQEMHFAFATCTEDGHDL
ncbi:MAG: aldose epimerase family protein [Gemmobacter sp.]